MAIMKLNQTIHPTVLFNKIIVCVDMFLKLHRVECVISCGAHRQSFHLIISDTDTVVTSEDIIFLQV